MAQRGYGAILDAGCGTGLAGRFLHPLLVIRVRMHHRKCLILLHNAPYRKGVDYQHHHQIQTILLLDFLSHPSPPATSTKHSVVFFIIRNADQSSDPALCSGGPFGERTDQSSDPALCSGGWRINTLTLV